MTKSQRAFGEDQRFTAQTFVAVEPNGPPVFETEFKGAPEWFADMGDKKSSGLGEAPLTYDPPLKPGRVAVDQILPVHRMHLERERGEQGEERFDSEHGGHFA